MADARLDVALSAFFDYLPELRIPIHRCAACIVDMHGKRINECGVR